MKIATSAELFEKEKSCNRLNYQELFEEAMLALQQWEIREASLIEREKIIEEKENSLLSCQKKPAGRPTHNEAWQNDYIAVTRMLDDGKSIEEIIETTGKSRATIYRLKKYYKEILKNTASNSKCTENIL